MTLATTKEFRGVSEERADEYVEWIIKLCARDTGARSALRRGLRRAPEQAITMHRYVARWTESLGRDEWVPYTVAALIAAQPRKMRKPRAGDEAPTEDAAPKEEAVPAEDTARREDAAPTEDKGQATKARRPNLGATLGRLGGDSDRVDGLERRLHLLVRQGVPGIQRHLPGVIRLLASAEIAPDWGVLLRDLSWWRTRRDQVASRWLQDYYRERFREEPANEPSGE